MTSDSPRKPHHCGLPVTAPLDDALRMRFDQLIGWAKAAKNLGYYQMGIDNVDGMTADLIGIVREECEAHQWEVPYGPDMCAHCGGGGQLSSRDGSRTWPCPNCVR